MSTSISIRTLLYMRRQEPVYLAGRRIRRLFAGLHLREAAVSWVDEDRESEAPTPVTPAPFTITERPPLVARGLCGPALPGPVASPATELDHMYESSCGVRVHLPPVRNSSEYAYGKGNKYGEGGAGAAASAKAMAAAADAGRERGSSSGSSSGVGSERYEEENAYSELHETAAATKGTRRTRSGVLDSFHALLHRSHEGRPNERGAHMNEAPGAAADVAAVAPKSPSAAENAQLQLQRWNEITGTQVEMLDDSMWTPTPTPTLQFLAGLELQFAANASAAAGSSAWGEGELSREGEYASLENFFFPEYDSARAPEQTAKCRGESATGFAPACAFSAAASAMKSGDKGVKPERLDCALSNNYGPAPAPGIVESCEEEGSVALYDELSTKTTQEPEPNTYENEGTLTLISTSSVVHASPVPARSEAGAVAAAAAAAESLYDVPRSLRGDLPERPQMRAASASDRKSGEEKQAAVLHDDNAEYM